MGRELSSFPRSQNGPHDGSVNSETRRFGLIFQYVGVRFRDGSVRLLTQDIDATTLSRLANRKDGKVIGAYECSHQQGVHP